MFISSDKVRERLHSSKNRLAPGRVDSLDDSPAPSVPASPASDETDERDERREIPESHQPTLEEMRALLQSQEQDTLDFTALNAIISGDFLEDRVGKGHGARKYRLDTDSQTAIGEVAALTTQATAAALFGISQAQVHAYDNAASSSNHVARGEHKGDLKARLDSFKEVLAAKAAMRLHETLDLLDGEKLAGIKRATNLARVGKDLATIMRNVEERLDRGGQESVVFHVFKPLLKKEEDYEVVTATIVGRSGSDDLPKL